MAHLQAVLFWVGREFGTAEHCGDVHAVEHAGDLGLLGGTCLLDCALQEQTRRIAARRVVPRLNSVPDLEALRELCSRRAKIRFERDLRLPLGRDRNTDSRFAERREVRAVRSNEQGYPFEPSLMIVELP